MVDKFNNKQLFLKKLLYRSKYTGIKETDILLGAFAEKYLCNFNFDQLVSYEKLIDSGDKRIWNLSINQEISNNKKEQFILKLLKEISDIDS